MKAAHTRSLSQLDDFIDPHTKQQNVYLCFQIHQSTFI